MEAEERSDRDSVDIEANPNKCGLCEMLRGIYGDIWNRELGDVTTSASRRGDRWDRVLRRFLRQEDGENTGYPWMVLGPKRVGES